MHRFDCEERVVLENGVLCRIVTACGTGKFKGRSMDVAKIYEDGRQLCRNIQCQPIAGWCISWPGEREQECYGGGYYGKPYVAIVEPYSEPYGDISGCSWGRPDVESKKAFVKKYPEFKWILKKSELSNKAYFHLLPYWKKYPHEIELLLAAGYRTLALDGRLWRVTDEKRMAVLEWIRAHRSVVDFPCLDGIFACIKYGCTYGQWCEYRAETGRYSWVPYDVFRWLKDRLKRNRSLWAELRQYRDYADMAKEAGHDLRDRYWRFPKNLKKAHDKVMLEVSNIRAAKKAEEMREKEALYVEAIRKWNGKEISLGNGMHVYVPTTVEDIVKQAEALKQCLIAGDYIGKVIDGRCVLVFVRYRNKPLATAEILPGGKLGQFYGMEADREHCAPTKKAAEALNAWQQKFIKVDTRKRAKKEAA